MKYVLLIPSGPGGKSSLMSEVQLFPKNVFHLKSFQEQGDLLEHRSFTLIGFLLWTLINSFLKAISSESDLPCLQL